MKWRIVKTLPDQSWSVIRTDPIPEGPSKELRPPRLNAIFFVDNYYGWAVGEGGTLVRTTDGGSTWAVSTIEPKSYLYGVHFVDRRHGWASGSSADQGRGIIFTTQDGGADWHVQKIIKSFHLSSVNGVWFQNREDGWAVGYAEGTGRKYGPWAMVWRTKDGGESWNTQLRQQVDQEGLLAVRFINNRDGWTAGPDRILHTDDGGRHWIEQYQPDESVDPYFMGLALVSASEGWVVGGLHSGNLLRTTDEGKDWRQASLSPMGKETRENHGRFFYSVAFADRNTGWVGSNDGTVLSTRDAGVSWMTERTAGEPGSINGIAYTSKSVFAVGSKGAILRRSR